MTFDEIVSRVAVDLNLTSLDAIARIGNHVNMKYQELVAKPWLQISRRGVSRATTTVNNRYLTFPVTKIYSVFDPNNNDWVLSEATFDELRNTLVLSDPPQQYAVAKQNSRSITVFLDSKPASEYTLHADADLRVVTLSGSQEPLFDEDFHDILYYWAKYLELMKVEKAIIAQEALEAGNALMRDLQFHIAKSAYLDRRQGKNSQGTQAIVNTIIQ